MTFGEALLPEFDSEMATTRRFLERSYGPSADTAAEAAAAAVEARKRHGDALVEGSGSRCSPADRSSTDHR